MNIKEVVMSLLNEVITKSTKKRLTRASIRTGLLLLIICLISGSTDKCPGCQDDIKEFGVVEGSKMPIITEVRCTGKPVDAEDGNGDTKVYRMLPLESCGSPKKDPSIDITFFVKSLARVSVKIDETPISHEKFGNIPNDVDGYFFSKTRKCNSETWKWNINVYAPYLNLIDKGGFNIEIQCEHPLRSDEKVYSTGIQVKFRRPTVILTSDRSCVNQNDEVTFTVETYLADSVYFTCDPKNIVGIRFNTSEFYYNAFHRTFTPDGETEYKIIAEGPGGTAVGPDGEAGVTYTVKDCNGPGVTGFKATPAKIFPCESSTLSWKAKGDRVELKELEANGKTWDVTGKSSFVVAPTTNTTYQITASNNDGDSSQSTTTTVTVLDEDQSTTIKLKWGAAKKCLDYDEPNGTPDCYGGQWEYSPASTGCEALIKGVKGLTPGSYTIHWVNDSNSASADVKYNNKNTNTELTGKTVAGTWYGTWPSNEGAPEYIEIRVFWKAQKKIEE